MKIDTKALRELMHPGSTFHVVSAAELRSLCDAYDALTELVAREQIAARHDEAVEFFFKASPAWAAARQIINPTGA